MATAYDAEFFKSLTVLIAGGKAHSRQMLRSILLQLGGKSIFDVSDGAAALNALHTFDPDVMIIDWDLPVVSASDVLRMVRQSDSGVKQALAILVISTSPQSSHVREAIAGGAQQFLVRPISPKLLERRIIAMLSSRC
jgi:two-component system chemotaxis response regulator CheY